MTGFSGDWLALREPYDHIARAGAPLQLLTSWSRDRSELHVTDLGSGTGSNLRGIAPVLASDQSWTLVEIDDALIERGQQTLAEVERNSCRWCYRRLDLSVDLEPAISPETDLVTASALIDLVSESWLDRLLAVARERHCGLYLTLSYNGAMHWDPVDDFDREAHRLFEVHQRRDKGFGAALGGDASRVLVERLYGTKGRVQEGDSDWLFGPSDVAIQTALLESMALAGKQVDPSAAPALDQWAMRRRSHLAAMRSHCEVGHKDLLYLPNSRIA